MTDYSHLNDLQFRLHNEQQRLANAVRVDEIKLRKVWVHQIEKEIDAEYKFLGVEPLAKESILDEELLAELFK